MIFSELPAPIRAHLITNFPPISTLESRTVISNSGMVAVWNTNRTQLAPVGCDLCYLANYGQNDDANPTVQGKALIRAEENMILGGALGPSVRANLWLCPFCKMPQAKLLPKFQ